MNLLKWWRESGWQEIDAEHYQQASNQFGHSVITHPLLVKTVSTVTATPLRYIGKYEQQKLTGAVPLWGKYIAGNKQLLKKLNKHRLVDTGNAEVILPLSEAHSFNLRFKTTFLSCLHQRQINGLKQQHHTTISLLKSYTAQTPCFSKKFKYNMRRELRLFQEAGGYYKAVDEISVEDFCDIYTALFVKRHNKKPKGYENLSAVLQCLRPLQRGFILYDKTNQPVAVQLLLQAESPQWVSVEYINGGVDPAYKHLSPGSVLSYLNTRTASEYADSVGKVLRFSFGKTDAKYKDLWCYQSPVFYI
ncbi:MAG: GNAT family N-acetyltransferase [Endozoicomonadaceae bacterium]|nr:GNAT family N-acetyltransferase [Endozoicomonadaceae bacterium]